MDKILFFLIALCISQITPTLLFSQTKRVVVMGSSTADGANATPSSAAWVPKLQAHFRRNTSAGNPDTVVTEIAESGQATWHQMPTGWANVPGRPLTDQVDVSHNVTLALSMNPDVVIINLPSNDVASGQYYIGYTLNETMNNFRLLFSTITATGARCFITTTQPRNDLNATYSEWQRRLKDSINATFSAFAIDFWTDLVTSGNTLHDAVRDGTSDYHLNNTGHNYLFLRVRDKDIFNSAVLPVRLTEFKAQVRINEVILNWRSSEEDNQTYYEVERSANGINFDLLHKEDAQTNGQSSSYLWTDHSPLQGKSFYRIKVSDASHSFYSSIVFVQRAVSSVILSRLYPVPAKNILSLEMSASKPQRLLIELFDSGGRKAAVYQKNISGFSKTFTLPIHQLSAGNYILKLTTGNQEVISRAFTKD